MEQLKKSFFIIMLIGMLCVNIFFMTQDFLKHTPDIALKFSMILNIPFFIILVLFIILFHRPAKLMINYFFLLCSFLCFAFVLLDTYLYYSVPTYNYSSFFIEPILLFGFLFVLFLLLAYRKNFKKTPEYLTNLGHGFVIFFSLVFVEFVCLTSTFLIVPSSDINNPDRYDFVKMHYFTPEDLASFPDEIPEDATNVILSYNGEIFNSSRKSLLLEFDSNTITSDNHHASFYVEVDQ